MEHYQKLILVTHRQQTPVLEYLELIKECAAEGITAVQLREKEAPLAFLLEFGTRLKEVLSPFNIPLIVNDSIDLAKKLDAEGVHVGNSDGDPAYARRVLGPEKIIGVSLETMDDLKAANRLEGRLYVAASSVFATKNKNNLKTIWGLAGLQNLVKHSRHPVLAIGGVTDVNVYEVLKTGASGIAVIGAIHEAYDPAKATRDLRKILDQHFT
ncbi:MAG: thiamine phosphate synthase [Proteobacteria bacterium]|nr:thiamine phosphate synthase [Pseudomonadota bacterium]